MEIKRLELDMDKIYHSNNYGDFKVLEIEEKNGYKSRKAIIEFIDTGAINTASIYNILSGNVRDKSIPPKRYDNVVLDFDKIYQSKNYGTYKIISDAGKNKKGAKMVKIRFLDTGCEKITTYSLAISGNIRDNIEYDKSHKIDFDKIYQSKNYGEFKILAQIPSSRYANRMVTIQFLNTNSISNVILSRALKGDVSDPSVARVIHNKTKIDFDKIYQSNKYGNFKILAEAGKNKHGQRLVEIEFINTGYKSTVLYSNAKAGKVADYS